MIHFLYRAVWRRRRTGPFLRVTRQLLLYYSIVSHRFGGDVFDEHHLPMYHRVFPAIKVLKMSLSADYEINTFRSYASVRHVHSASDRRVRIACVPFKRKTIYCNEFRGSFCSPPTLTIVYRDNCSCEGTHATFARCFWSIHCFRDQQYTVRTRTAAARADRR